MNIHWLGEGGSPLNDTKITESGLYFFLTEQAHAFTCPDSRQGELKITMRSADTFSVCFLDYSDGFHYEISHEPLFFKEDFEDVDLDAARRMFADFLQRISTRQLCRTSLA